ncbi:DUF2599 domain-containing protein [Cellulomonas sp. S1-8]|uniref:DUF2599 domain-containing protein n=1 Tax=Cellulomonas sp. S1-8 TaxID=2904790 RepID=UPI002244DE23|nr:DUF2599 domain-containing protein [Cellulomonas sp. S1-8]UZN02603.1 DUF2599 domain-containing protein [Cellulomonas sp. S1-8]
MAVRGAVRVVVATGVVLLVAGCGPGDEGPGPAMTSARPLVTPAPGAPQLVAPPGAGIVRDTGAPLADQASLGHDAGALLPVDGAGLQLEDGADGATRTTVVGPAGTLAWVAPPRGGHVEVQTDGSATLHDEAGTVVTALGPATGADDTRGSWRPVGGVLALDAPTGSATFVVGVAAVASATWGEADGGPSLLVVPAGWVRRGSLAAQQALVSQVAQTVPEAASASMQAQLWCHVLGAPDKASWDVEPWRPEVSTATMLLTRCNPTDVDV